MLRCILFSFSFFILLACAAAAEGLPVVKIQVKENNEFKDRPFVMNGGIKSVAVHKGETYRILFDNDKNGKAVTARVFVDGKNTLPQKEKEEGTLRSFSEIPSGSRGFTKLSAVESAVQQKTDTEMNFEMNSADNMEGVEGTLKKSDENTDKPRIEEEKLWQPFFQDEEEWLLPPHNQSSVCGFYKKEGKQLKNTPFTAAPAAEKTEGKETAGTELHGTVIIGYYGTEFTGAAERLKHYPGIKGGQFLGVETIRLEYISESQSEEAAK
jgi:hypothetical protein